MASPPAATPAVTAYYNSHQWRSSMKTYLVEQAVRAQKALRDAAGLCPEMFPIQAFVGMISDEIKELRSQGKTDEDIARLITANSSIEITAAEITQNYASPDDRHPSHR
jgi:hypothetical protein